MLWTNQWRIINALRANVIILIYLIEIKSYRVPTSMNVLTDQELSTPTVNCERLAAASRPVTGVRYTILHGVGAQLTSGGQDFFCQKNMYEKLSKCPNFYDICPKN